MKMLIVFMVMFFASNLVLAQDPAPAAVAASPTPPPAPPEWVLKALTVVEGVPGVGPIVSKAVQIIAILGSIMTLLVAFLLSLLKIVSPFMSLVNADKVAAFLDAQQKAKWMYWLKWFSFFNAKKPDVPVVAAKV